MSFPDSTQFSLPATHLFVNTQHVTKKTQPKNKKQKQNKTKKQTNKQTNIKTTTTITTIRKQQQKTKTKPKQFIFQSYRVLHWALTTRILVCSMEKA